MLRADVNGKAFSPGASAQDYAQYIAAALADYDRYQNLALSAWQNYRQHLSWGAAQQQAWEILQELVTMGDRPQGLPWQRFSPAYPPSNGDCGLKDAGLANLYQVGSTYRLTTRVFCPGGTAEMQAQMGST
ncbi:MAG TPA: hypothetical protein VEZ50_15610 [Nodosilinea sp.]|nr:hypothetical protein [Nodosilinea sp.]